MSALRAILDALGVDETGATVYPDTFIDDVGVAYDEDMSLPASRIQILEADLAAAQQEIIALKAHNYELITSAPTNEVEPDEAPDEEDEDEDAPSGVDALFGKE